MIDGQGSMVLKTSQNLNLNGKNLRLDYGG